MGKGDLEKSLLQKNVDDLRESLDAAKDKLKELQEAKNDAGLGTSGDSDEDTKGTMFGGVMAGDGSLDSDGPTRDETLEKTQEFYNQQVEAYAIAQEAMKNLTLIRINEELKAEQDKAAAEKKLMELKIKGAKTALSSLSSLMNTENRKMFEVGKAAAVAQTIMNTYQSVTKAMAEVPYPANFAVAAAALASGLNNVNNIRNTQFGSAGGGAASTGGAAGLGSDGSTTAAPAVQNVTEATINVNGSVFGRETVEQIANELNELSDDGFVIRTGS